ncbi:MAG: restriction endonuclease subunit S [[Lactobacillus] timonensis]|jgi:type I restriction enzyme S subunit|nr:restriction endonuclease subunit S [[Lactobacillus] timonensis]
MAKKVERRVPNLRFKGFTDDWEQRKLKKEYDKIGNAFVGTASPYYVNNGHFYLESNNIKDGQINHNHEVFINDDFYRKQFGKYLHTGDLVMVQSGHVGDTAVITHQYNNSSAHALIMFRKPKTPFLSDYLNNYFQSEIARNKIKVLAIGNTISHILASDMSKFTANIPNQLEQKKISKIFKTLQATISLQQRKLELLKQLKKGFLQKMFAGSKSKKPLIRIQDFSNEWEERRLGTLAQIVGGGTPNTKNPKYWNGSINWYAPAELYNGQIYTSHSKRSITELGLQNCSAKILPVGTLLFTSRAGIGKTAILLQEATTNQGFQSIVPKKDELDSYFAFLLTNQLKKYGETHGAGSTFIEISGKELSKAPIKLPLIQEQKRISQFNQRLDRIVSCQQIIINNLANLKKFLLQQMFI